MTKSTITREQLLEIIETDHVQCGEASYLARMALAAMDSSESVELPLDYLQGHKDGLEWAAQLAEANHPETGDWVYDDPIELSKAIRKCPDMPPSQPVADSEPVAIIDQANLDYLRSGADADVWPPEREEMGDVLLYRHAQPAPVVVPNGLRLALSNAGIAAPESDEMLAATCEKHIQALVTWVKDRKPFQSAPVVPDAYVRDESGRMMLNGVCEPKIGFGTGWNACRAAMFNHPEQHLDMVDNSGDVNENGGDGNYPVIPDGWTCNDKANAALMMLDRIETVDPIDDDRIDGIKRIVRELAAAHQEVK